MLQLTASYIVEMGVTNLTQAKLLKEAEEKAALQTALHSVQLRALQSQVNPHFLFNSLALISYTALEENAPRTEEIAYCLSDLLRYNLRYIAATVTLEQELDIIEHYLTIQKLRFGAQLQSRIEVEPGLRQARIPSMILQPLVENAVNHGVEPLTRPVTIQVRAYRQLNRLILEVQDDGAGIDAAIMTAVNARTFTYKQSDRTSIGLQNVIQRLEAEYGEACTVHIEGGSGQGTRVMLLLPLNSPLSR
jgi:sensor histidine kinase YesM